MCFRPPQVQKPIKCPECGALNPPIKQTCMKCQADFAIFRLSPVNWFEIPVSDLARAQKFYENVSGYELNSREDTALEMAGFPLHPETPGTSGALIKASGHNPSDTGTVLYLATKDIAKTLERVCAGGGKALSAVNQIDNLGMIAHFQDSESNRVGLLQAKIPTKNVAVWFEIPVNDLQRAKMFYEKVFGYSLDLNQIGSLRMAWFPMKPNSAGASGALVKADGYKPADTGTVVYLPTKNIASTLEKVNANGGVTLLPNRELGGLGKIAHFQDSEGNRVGLLQGQ